MSEPKPQEEARPSLFPAMEKEIAARWKHLDVFRRSIEERSERKGYSFYDGPPFATGLPHYGHLLQSAIKDAVPRYWTMQGYRIPRRWGWDCHGLPIENMIEKELKLTSKRDIEAYGIDKFNAACRSSIFAFEKDWPEYIERLGRWVDFDHAYKTMDVDYIESVWWAFSELYKKKHVFKSVRVSLYCPRCETPLSNFEVAMDNSYVEAEDPAVFVKFPVKGEDRTYFLAWTTTPWTLPANTGLSVHPDLMYVSVRLEDRNETLIFAEARQGEVLKQYYPLEGEGAKFEIVGRWKGSELVGKRYDPLYAFLPVEGDGFRVVSGEHVTADDGTGIVHTAPAFGEDDLLVGQKHGLPVLDTVNGEGRMIDAMGKFAGMKVKDANPVVLEDLQERGLLYRAETITHSVPICWRCKTMLLYKAQPAWFVDITKLKTKMLKTAEKISWHPEHLKEGRFGKGLQTAPDWNISRSRYWGSPIPVWECDRCDERTVIGSRAELKKIAKPETWPETLDLHRPVIDRIVLPCACGGEQKRIPEVFDCWFESGSMPFASQHYPFENKKWFENNFPADFIGEAQDQTRGWFYTLHVLATALFGKPAFKNVIVTGHILAEDGKKMSKSLKNYPDPGEILEKHGGDALRYYLFTSPVVEGDAFNFSERDLQNIVRGFLNILWNVSVFYGTYSHEDVRITKPRSAHVLDRWIFSRFEQLLAEVTHQMDHYELAKAARPIREFVDELSTWWLRRSRDRLKSDNAYERMDALRTLREILEELSKVIAPFMPFIADKMYLNVGGSKASVHLEKWPKADRRTIDERLLADMQWVRDVVSKGHEQRVNSKIAVRQALASVQIRFTDATQSERLKKQGDLLQLIKEELNVEAVVLEGHPELSNEAWTVTLDTRMTPELRAKGLRREFARHAMNMRKEAKLQPADRIHLAFTLEEGDAATAVLAGLEELQKDLRADTLERVDALPQGVVLEQEVKMDGKPLTLYLIAKS